MAVEPRQAPDPGFAPDEDAPIAYIERTRTYYQALGYGAAYRWARFAEVPFHRLPRPLAEATVALVTTAALHRRELGDQGPGAPYNATAKFYRVYSEPVDGRTDVRISHVAYDRVHTSAVDPRSWFPVQALAAAVNSGRIGRLAPRFHGMPTNRSQRATMQQDAPDLLARLREDGAEAAVLVANCPVCHQSVALAARHLEAGGIATVVMGCAKDIVETVGVPRLLFSDFPLGNAAGRPGDPDSQRDTLALALDLLEAAPAARTTVQSPQRWSADPAWKRDYGNVDRLSPEELARLKASFDAGRAVARSLRETEQP